MGSTEFSDNTGKIIPFVFERDYVDFILIEMDRFDQPMTRTLLSFLQKRYGDDYWYTVDISGDQRIDVYLIAGTEKDKEDNDVVHVYTIAVRREFEGEGWAKKLMKHLIENTRKDNFQSIILEVRENNARALAFYGHLGFEITGREKNYYSDDVDAINMKFVL